MKLKNKKIVFNLINRHYLLLKFFSLHENNFETLEFVKYISSGALDSAVDGKPFTQHHVSSVGNGKNSKDEAEQSSVEIGDPQPSL